MGAGSPADTGKAGAIHRVAGFAAVRCLDLPAPITPTIRARTLE
ncbi:diguanylate cyclase [Pseudomonas plecoglossicida]|uniref:Diguanylate cyclase n=1 Tax=Pseudomonas plecoglossicida TaxID=70775 RepID=A0A2R7UL66_PSEDL|nr:diguanylate cyclase [Pseudomonas plecoglossicida]